MSTLVKLPTLQVQGAYGVFRGYLLVKIRREHQAAAVPVGVRRGAIPSAS